MMGYPNHAAFITEIRMSKTPDAVMEFLMDLSDKLTPVCVACSCTACHTSPSLSPLVALISIMLYCIANELSLAAAWC